MDVWKPADHPRHGAFLAGFMQATRRAHRDYALVNLKAATAEALARDRQGYLAVPNDPPTTAQATPYRSHAQTSERISRSSAVVSTATPRSHSASSICSSGVWSRVLSPGP